MNGIPSPRLGNQRRRRPARRTPTDLWRDAGPLPDVEPVVPSNDPTTLLRSLGEPPMADAEAVLLRYATVIERSASVATALALSAGVLGTEDHPPPPHDG